MALGSFADARDDKYPQSSKSWRAHWENLNTFLDCPPDIRKAIYTKNALESLNSMFRLAIKKRKVFPADDSVRKVVYLAIKDASKKWNMPIQNWRLAMSRFITELGDCLSDHLYYGGSYTELGTGSIHFSFFDYRESILLFYLRYLSIIILFSLIIRFLLWYLIFRKCEAA